MSDAGSRMEIAHVLFLDIVGYSKKLIDEQRRLVQQLNELVRGTEQVRNADRDGKLIRVPTGDGMALAFFTTPDDPVRCAIEVSHAVRERAHLQLRMGLHSGPVDQLDDVNERANLAGAGINIAQRVMDCGDAGHILLSQRIADDLAHYGRWQPHLHELGEVEVKHGLQVGIVNLYSEDFGNAATPEKLKRAEDERLVLAKTGQKRATRRRVLQLAVAAVALALLLATAFWFVVRGAERAARARLGEAPAKSVAVLPFENLSEDPANGYFASGIQDEIITRLAKIAALKVISRTSTAAYGSKPGNLPQIAKELGVAAILEGTVQKVGSQIRVNVQLIKAATDVHLWADIYDRELIDVLKVESEVAQEIASALRATLTPDEKARIEKKPTDNADAYSLYLHALQVENTGSALPGPLEEAQHLYEQAIALDPQFALAHAHLSNVHTRIYRLYQPLEVHKTGARSEAEAALLLQPDLGEAHVAMGNYFARVEQNYDVAFKEFAIAHRAAPSDSSILHMIGTTKLRQGQFKEAIRNLEQASGLDPRNWAVWDDLGNAYGYTQQRSACEKAKKHAADMAPPPPISIFNEKMSWAGCYWDLTGSSEKVDAVLAEVPPGYDPDGHVTFMRWSTRMLERDFDDAERTLQACEATIFDEWNGPRLTKKFLFGQTELARGNVAKARDYFDAELPFAQSELNETSGAANRHAQIGLLYAYLNRKDEAIFEGKRAVELLPISKDAFEGPWLEDNLAEIYVRVGEADEAINLLEKLLTVPGGEGLHDLRQNWIWDPLRNHPRFQKILASPEPKVIYQ